MTERMIGPERIVGVISRNGDVTELTVKMADGTTKVFIPAVDQPMPVIRSGYIGRHERTAGGVRYE